MNFVQKVRQAWQLLDFIDFESGEVVEVRQIADAAYKANVTWFGAPQDVAWSHRIVQSAFTGCSWSVLTRGYTLHIGRENVGTDQLCSAIGHEMYHRVTARRKTLRRQLWIDELLAFSVQQRFLREQGFEASAKEVDSHVLQSSVKVAFDWLHQVRTKRVLFGFGGISYPPDFKFMIGRLSLALDHLLEWPAICLLANVSSLEAWYAQLEPSASTLAVALLTSEDTEGTEEETRLAPLLAKVSISDDLDGWLGLTQAYQLLGHLNASEFLLRHILASYPEQSKALGGLANLLYQRKQYREAILCYEQALDLTPTNAWIRQNYGVALYVTGKKEQAREQWKTVVEQGDEEQAEACTAFLARF